MFRSFPQEGILSQCLYTGTPQISTALGDPSLLRSVSHSNCPRQRAGQVSRPGALSPHEDHEDRIWLLGFRVQGLGIRV